MPKQYFFLMIAVVFETIGTSALEASQQMSKIIPAIIVIIAYAISFYFMSLTLKYMPVGIVYALWSGLGIVLIAIAGWLIFGQKLDFAAILGLGMILGGVMVINLFSNSATH